MFNNTVKLLSVPFDNTYEENILFTSREEQMEWFDKQETTPASNPVSQDYGSGVVFTVVVNAHIPVFKALNYNYIILGLLNANEPIKNIFAFIRESKYISAQTYRYTCEVDVIQTYMLDIKFDDCVIRRAHLQRFDKNLLSIKFKNRIDSKLLLSEGLEPVKYKREIKNIPVAPLVQPLAGIINRSPQGISSVNDEKYRFLNENIKGYIYIFCDSAHSYQGFGKLNEVAWSKKTKSGNTAQQIKYKRLYTNNIACICIPLLTSMGSDKVQINNKIINLDLLVDSFISLNGDYIYKIMISPYCLIDFDINASLTFNASKTVININNANLPLYANYTIISGEYGELISLKDIPLDPFLSLDMIEFDYYADSKLNFNDYPLVDASFILGSPRDMALNPKLYTSEFVDITLSDFAGNSWEYDLRLLNTATPTLVVNTSYQPSFSGNYIRLINLRELYNPIQNENFIFDYSGIVSGADVSLPFTTDAYASFLATNKNYYEMAKSNIQTTFANQMIGKLAGVASIGVSAATGNLAGVVTGGVSIASGMLQAGLNDNNAYKQLDYKLNNIKNSPASIANASNNVFLWLGRDEGLDCRAELNICSDSDLKRADDFMYLYGFRYSEIDAVLPNMTLRQIFNYIEAELNGFNTYYGLSNPVKTKYRQIFKNGIRLWRNTPYIFQYTYENWEDTPLTQYPA